MLNVPGGALIVPRQFQILSRSFLSRIIDPEILSAGGDAQKLLIQFVAVLAAFSLVLAVVYVRAIAATTIPHDQLLAGSWKFQEFLTSTTMAVAGVFAVLSWNTMFLDRRDCLILGLLPVRTRTILLAKLAAVGIALSVTVASINCFTGLSLPFVLVPSGSSGLRSLAAYWLAQWLAALFVFCTLLAVQGIAAQALPYAWFLRVSGAIQLLAFFVIVGGYFLSPPFPIEALLSAPEIQRYLVWLPSFWFFGLMQHWNGSVEPVFGALAARALVALSVVVLAGLATLTLAYHRGLNRITEQPDIAPGSRFRPAARAGRWAATALFPRPLDRAILLFTARTMVRSRQHRLVLAAYFGAGLALALAYVKTLIYVTFILPGYSAIHFSQPNTSLAAASLAILFFAVIGTRAAFALPADLRANWIFVITAVHRPSAYFAAVRKSLSMVTVAPVWIGAAVFYLALWPAGAALEHLSALGIAGVLLIQKSLREFRKIPFACSYLPGKSNLNVKVGAYAILFLAATEAFVNLELWSMDDVVRFTLFAGVLSVFALRARSQTAEFARAPSIRLQFEDAPDAVVHALDLRRDGAWSSDQAYVDAIDRHFGRGLATRARPFAIGVAILACSGFLWELFCERLDNWRFPQVGRSVDIGGRSLNLFCSGEGTPTVILESGWTAPGYSWVRVQREIAAITRTCWYDRAGYGWSDPGPNPHWSDSAARDLHALLERAQLPPPYVLVGASLGGLNVQVYNGLYPGEAAGMVLVDTALTDASNMPDVPKRTDPPRATTAANLFLADAFGHFGLFRLTASPENRPPTYTQREWDLISNLKSRRNARLAWMKESPIEASADVAAAEGKIDDLPLIVLTAGRSLRPAQQKMWNELQAELAGRSRRGEQIVVQNSGHDIASEYPEAVVDAVRKVVAETRHSTK